MSRAIFLSGKRGSGKVTFVDNEDYGRLCLRKWYLREDGYIVSTTKGKSIFLHRLVMNAPTHSQVDHINHIKFDNQKSNLRVCNRNQNAWNRNKSTNNRSGHKNVSWSKVVSKWRVDMVVNGIYYSAGYYTDLKDAIRARNDCWKKLHGKFANLAA